MQLICSIIAIILISNMDNSLASSFIKKISSIARHNVSSVFRGGYYADYNDSDLNEDQIEISGSLNQYIDGLYIKNDLKINGMPHFVKELHMDQAADLIPSGVESDSKCLHLYYSGSQWIIHYDVDPTRNFDNLLAYSKAKTRDPLHTSKTWHVKNLLSNSYEVSSTLVVLSPQDMGSSGSIEEGVSNKDKAKSSDDIIGLPRRLLPLYISFMFDSIAVGLAMPLLPFYIMELGANAFQLSLVVSSNYVVQMMGCLIMGAISDRFGRKVVLLSCLMASCLSYFAVSHANGLVQVALARIIVGSCGGLVPVMQSCVADVSDQKDRPQYLGRVTATFGLGFVLGPALSALLPSISTRTKIRMAAILPLIGFFVSFFFFKETKQFTSNSSSSNPNNKIVVPSTLAATSSASSSAGTPSTTTSANIASGTSSTSAKLSTNSGGLIPFSTPILLLVLNGFLIMYAFATETIYAMFLKDSFGYGERTLSMLFAMNGMFIGIFQVFFIKPMVGIFGKHMTLAFGNSLLAIGMLGVALIRKELIHFMLFALHIVGYSIADTALVSLITRYSSPASQGRDLALNQSAQSCARVLGPLLAGMLYERSKVGRLPVGALPFIAGALCPLLGIAVPLILYNVKKSQGRKVAKVSDK